jgi:hypothetical protein
MNKINDVSEKILSIISFLFYAACYGKLPGKYLPTYVTSDLISCDVLL